MFYRFPKVKETLFPGSAAYRRLLGDGSVQESAGRYFPYTERHLQALWYDDSLRPKKLKTSRGEPVTVENAGGWNLEAGPDFHHAVLLIGREQRRVAGDAEIHIFSNDWKNHGHAGDPRYSNVRFHITWFSGPVDESLFYPGTVHLTLSESCAVDLESIDLTAYPYEEPRAASEFPMLGKNPDHLFQILEAAGEERLRQKTQRMVWLIEQRGEAQALYEETAAALGYKNNKQPFRELARRLSLDALTRYGAEWKTIYCVLLGISGLLPKQPGVKWPEASKKELRSLWDLWWKEEHRWEDVERMGRTDWNLSGMRPLNHPVRRLCALAQWVACGFFEGGNTSPRRPFVVNLHGEPRTAGITGAAQRCFWSEHIGWTGKEKKAELVGKGRLQAIELNVMVPFRLATGKQTSLENLPVEPMNSIIRETAYTLFGPDHSPKLYCTALARQGLIQIFNDFILTGRVEEFLTG